MTIIEYRKFDPHYKKTPFKNIVEEGFEYFVKNNFLQHKSCDWGKDLHCIIAIYDYTIAGIIVFENFGKRGQPGTGDDKDTTYVSFVYLKESFRRHGLFSMMYKELLVQIPKLKFNNKIAVYVNKDNIAAIVAYIKYGFEKDNDYKNIHYHHLVRKLN